MKSELTESSPGRAGESEHQLTSSLGSANRAVSVALLAAVLSTRYLRGFEEVPIGDLLIIGFVAATMLSSRARPWHNRLRRLVLGPIGIVLLGLCVSVLVNSNSAWFDAGELARSSLKLCLYLLGFAGFVELLSSMPPKMVAQRLSQMLWLLAVVSVLQQFAYLLGFQTGLLAVYGRSQFDRSAVPRSASLFSEPAYLAIFVVVILLVQHRIGHMKRADLALGATILALAASLAGVGLALLSLGSVALHGTSTRRIFRAAAAGIVVATLVFVSPAKSVVERRVVDRVSNTVQGSDQSSNGRLVDSWLVAAEISNDHLLFGVGPGQLSGRVVEISRSGSIPDLDSRVEVAGGTWNVFANVLAEGGLVSLTGLLLFVGAILRRWWPAGLLLIAVGFSTGTFYGWLWWAVCALLAWASSTQLSSGGASKPGPVSGGRLLVVADERT